MDDTEINLLRENTRSIDYIEKGVFDEKGDLIWKERFKNYVNKMIKARTSCENQEGKR